MWNPEVAYQSPEVAATYDRARFTSTSGRRGAARERREFLRAMARLAGSRTVLDVPCGTGRMTHILAERRFGVVGADVSLAMMQQARRRLGDAGYAARLLRANVLSLPFSSGSFDVVTCVRLFGHFPSATRIQMLREMARVARRGIVVQYFCETPLTRLKRRIKQDVLHTYAGVTYPVNASTLRYELASAGLTHVERFWCKRFRSEEVFVLARTGPRGQQQ